MNPSTTYWKWGVILLMACGLLSLDLLYAIGVFWGINYVFVIFLSLWVAQKKAPYVAAGISSVFIFLDFLFAEAILTRETIILEKSISILLLWLIAYAVERKFNQVKIRSKNTNRFFLISIFIFLAMTAPFTIIYQLQVQNIEDKFVQHERDELQKKVNLKKKSLEHLFTDILLLRDLHNVKDVHTQKESVQQNLVAFMKVRPQYDQIRILDTTGKEIVRVNRENPIRVLAEDELQDKSSRDYYIKATELSEGQIYLSEIDLNQEHGKIERPLKPILRILSPIIFNNEKQGYLVINFLPFIDSKAPHSDDSFPIQIADNRGFLYEGVSDNLLFGHLKNTNSYSIKKAMPSVWKQISNARNGQLYSKSDFVIFTQFKWDEAFPETLEKRVKSPQHFSENALILMKQIPTIVLLRAAHKNAPLFGLTYSLILLLSSIIGVYIFKDRNASEITQLNRRILEQEILERNNLFNELQKLTKLGVWRVNLEQMEVYWDEMVYAIHELPFGTRLSVEEGIHFYHKDFQPIIKGVIDNAIANNEPWDVEAILVTAKNREIWVRAIGYPVFEDGKLTELRGTFMDIDTKKRNELLLAENEIRIRLAVDAAQLGIWDWDVKNNVLNWDSSMYKLYDVDPADFSGAFDAWKKTLYAEDVEAASKAVEMALISTKILNTSFRIVSKDGSLRHILAVANVTFDEQGNAVRMTGVNKNITNEVEAEAKIIALNQNLEQQVLERTKELNAVTFELEQQLNLLDTALILSTTDAHGNIQEVNNTLCDISGYTREELIGQKHTILTSAKSLRTYHKMQHHIETGKVWKGEICNRRKTGEEFWVELSIKPFFDNEGKLQKYLSISYDITTLKNAQVRLSKQSKSLEQTNAKLDAVNKELETFSYSVSHDLKAPLRAIQGFSKNLTTKYGDHLDETGERWLRIIQDNAEHMDHLIQDMLAFSRINKKQLHKMGVDMHEIIANQVEHFKEIYPNEVEVHIHDIFPVECDQLMIETVWQNLIENAFKYSSKQAKIEIEISSERQEDCVAYSIKDNGVGFDMRYYDKLFGVFQRLHGNEEFEGSGVGLASVQRIIQKHDGEIKAESKIGEGTTFEFKLPIN